MFMINRAVTTSRGFLSASLVIFAGLSLGSVSTGAYAESGSRVCVSDAGGYAIKIRKGTFEKRRCQDKTIDEGSLSRNVGFGEGRYMTCEAFANDYLRWRDWNPCPSMNFSSERNYRFRPSDSQIYAVAKLARDESIQDAGSCGVSSCSISYSYSKSRSFTYTAGVNVSVPTSIFGGSVGFSVGTSTTNGGTFALTWQKGERRGLAQRFASEALKYDLRNIAEIAASIEGFTKDFADVEEQKQINTGSTFYCNPLANTQVPYINNHTETTPAGFLSALGSYGGLKDEGSQTTTEASARFIFDSKATQFSNALYPVAYKDLFNRTILSCGLDLRITTNPTAWRGAEDQLTWGVRIIGRR